MKPHPEKRPSEILKVDVSPGGMPCRVYEWLLKDFCSFHGSRSDWQRSTNEQFFKELGLLIRFAESFEWKQEDKQ